MESNITIQFNKIKYVVIILFLLSVTLFPVFTDTIHMSDADFFELIDFSNSDLEEVKSALDQNNMELAKQKYVKYKSSTLFTNPNPITGTINKDKADLLIDHYIEVQSNGYYRNDDINWHGRPSTDKEYTWLTNRFFFLSTLARVYVGTGEEKYAEEFAKMFMDWYEEEPQGHKEFTWRTIDTAQRLRVFIQVYEAFENSTHFTADIKFKYYKSIWEQADYLKTFIKTSGNWGLIETNGLMWARCFFPELKDADNWEKRAWEVSTIITENDLLEDGVHSELSTMYHNVVVGSHLSYFEVLTANDYELDPYVYRRVEGACNFTMDMHGTTGRITTFGDSDANNYKNYLVKAAEFYDREDFKYIGTQGLEGTFPDHQSIAYPEAGYYIMRSGWDKDSTCLMFDAGQRGTGHTHWDCLSYSLDAFGQELLLDPGRGTYDGSHPERGYLKSNLAHNLFILDDTSIELKEPDSRLWYEASTIIYAGGKHSGFGDQVGRQILFPKSEKDYYIILDNVAGGSHKITNYMQFYDPNMEITDNGLNSTSSYSGKIETYSLQDWTSTELLVNSTDPLAGIYSPDYNVYQECTTAKQTTHVEGKASWMTLLLCKNSSKGEEVFNVEKLTWKPEQEGPLKTTDSFEDNINAISVEHSKGKEKIIWNYNANPIFWENYEVYPGITIFSYNATDYLESITLINSKQLGYNGDKIIEITDNGNFFNIQDSLAEKYVVCSSDITENTYINNLLDSEITHKGGVIEIE